MLRRLSVENYALIDKLELELDPHLNIITGETGAGKSILLGALGLLLGAKNDGSAMKDAARSCTVEGTFALAGPELEEFFAENDLEYAAETTLTRIITPAGKSRAFVNDVPVSLAQLREVGTRLLDIHSQHQNLILSSEEFRTSALDTVAGNGELLREYAAQYARLQELRRETAALREAAEQGRRDEEWLRFQTEELTAANLRAGEQAEIEEELAMLENADRIGEAFTTLCNALDADETGVLVQLKNSETSLAHIGEHYPAAAEYAARLRSTLEELKDIGASAAADSERIDADPERLAKLSARLDTLLALQHPAPHARHRRRTGSAQGRTPAGGLRARNPRRTGTRRGQTHEKELRLHRAQLVARPRRGFPRRHEQGDADRPRGPRGAAAALQTRSRGAHRR